MSIRAPLAHDNETTAHSTHEPLLSNQTPRHSLSNDNCPVYPGVDYSNELEQQRESQEQLPQVPLETNPNENSEAYNYPYTAQYPPVYCLEDLQSPYAVSEASGIVNRFSYYNPYSPLTYHHDDPLPIPTNTSPRANSAAPTIAHSIVQPPSFGHDDNLDTPPSESPAPSSPAVSTPPLLAHARTTNINVPQKSPKSFKSLREAVTSRVYSPASPRARTLPMPAEPSPSKSPTSLFGKLSRMTSMGRYSAVESEGPGIITRARVGIQWNGNGLLIYFLPVVLFLVTLVPLILCGIVFTMQDQPRSTPLDGVVQCLKVMPSLWPILFAAVVATMFKAIISQKLESGVTFGKVELFMGSQTIGGTIRTFWMMRKYRATRMLSFFLVCMWGLSPLGGQAALRSVAVIQGQDSTDLNMFYLGNDTLASMYNSIDNSTLPRSSLLLSTSLDAPLARLQYPSDNDDEAVKTLLASLGGLDAIAKSLAVDTFGNPLIPNIRELKDFDNDKSNQWIDVKWTENVVPYSSLLGVPVGGAPLNFTGDLALQMNNLSYHVFSCDRWIDVARNLTALQTIIRQVSYPRMTANITSLDALNRYLGSYFFLGALNYASYDTNINHRDVYFQSGTGGIRCSIETVNVEVQLECTKPEQGTRPTCYVIKMREVSPPAGLTSYRTFFDNSNATNIQTFTQWFSTLTVGSIADGQSSLESYLHNPIQGIWDKNPTQNYYDLSEIGSSLFEKRLGMLFETSIRSLRNPAALIGQDFSLAQNVEQAPAIGTNDSAEMYLITYAWLVIFLLCSIALALAVLVAILHLWSREGPDLLGQVAVAYRDSTHFDYMRYNSTLSEDRIPDQVWDIKVRVGDVHSDEKCGRIALAPYDRTRNIIKGRYYD